MFKPYPSVHKVVEGKSVYADAVNHCKTYRNFLVNNSVTSSVHELSHGIASEIRNSRVSFSTLDDPPPGDSYKVMLQPVGAQGRTNGFYLLEDRAIVLEEPNIRKKDCIKYIPPSMRDYRYKLYVQGQTAWDDTPLYIFDEWIAYANGAACVIDLDTNYKDGSTDYIYGPVEFIAYAVGILMAADAANSLNQKLIDFSLWHFDRVVKLYTAGIKILPWAAADKCMDKLKNSPDCKDIRDFLLNKIGFSFNPVEDEGWIM